MKYSEEEHQYDERQFQNSNITLINENIMKYIDQYIKLKVLILQAYVSSS